MLGCNGLFYHPDDIIYTDPTLAGQTVKPFIVSGSTDEKISGWYLPTQWPKQGLVLHFHGNAQNMTAHILFTFWLVDAGYDLVVFDYRGYGKSSGSPDREGMVIDARDVIGYVNSHFLSPEDDFIILAQSLGGAIAVPAVATAKDRRPDVFVIDSTFSSYRGIAQDKLAGFWLTWPLQWPLSFLVSNDFSPIDYADQIKMPVMMLHGTKDDVTPLAAARDLFEAFASIDKQMLVVPNGFHTSAFQEGSPYLDRLLQFLCSKSKNPQRCAVNRKLFSERYEARKKKSLEKDR
jgi:fermentation-respiration switch protein FrsA (DUF1100 family)